MDEKIIYAQVHSHSKFSINRLSGEGVFHKFVWPFERMIMKKLLMKSPKELLKMANGRGVDFVSITDHNNIPVIEEDSEFLITGEEWGQRKGHSNFINVDSPIDPECGYFKGIEPDNPKDFSDAAQEAKARGALVSINHPFKTNAWFWGEESYALADGIEIWNGDWCEENQRALELWQKLLVRGLKIWCFAGNDFHVNRLFNIDSQVLALRNVDSKSTLISKLKIGDFSISKDTHSPVIFLNHDLSYSIVNYKESIELRAISSNHTELINRPSKDGIVEKDRFQNFVRLELWEDGSPLSFSNPEFI